MVILLGDRLDVKMVTQRIRSRSKTHYTINDVRSQHSLLWRKPREQNIKAWKKKGATIVLISKPAKTTDAYTKIRSIVDVTIVPTNNASFMRQVDLLTVFLAQKTINGESK